MIARLRGRIAERAADEIVVDVAGVGYQVFVSAQTMAALPVNGSDVDVFVVTHVREDALQLFGFADVTEKALFQLLQSVSGIGPGSRSRSFPACRPRISATRSGDATSYD